MRKHFSFSHLLHKDKLMMAVSLVLAIVIWALVVYGQGDTQERDISGIPVSVTLTPYASEDLKLRIVEGADAKVTVRVSGTRSAIGPLTAGDITVVADTSAVLKEGTYTIPVRVTSSGKYDVVSLFGEDGANSTITITCDVWNSKDFPLNIDKSKVKLDEETLYFGDLKPYGDAIKTNSPNEDVASDTEYGKITISGPKSSVSRVKSVVAVISEAVLTETTSCTAKLVAYDENNRPVDSVTFVNAEDGEIKVVVPVMVYHKEDISGSLVLANGAEWMRENISVSPTAIELKAIPSALEDYLEEYVYQQLRINLDEYKAERKLITKTVELKDTDNVKPFENCKTIGIALDFSQFTNRVFRIPVTGDNLQINNLPEGYIALLEENVTVDVVLCGESSVLSNLDKDQLRLVVDVEEQSGHLELNVRVESDAPVWTYYGESGYEIRINIIKE